jgi:dolichol-phosphate mannosyltransferase
MKKNLYVIIPAYNEQASIVKILKKVEQVNLPQNYDKTLIVVDDGSTDNTAKLVNEFSKKHKNVTLLSKTNGGKGSAVSFGMKSIKGYGKDDYIIIQDADLEYDPEDYVKMLNVALRDNLVVLYGSRFLNRQNKHSYQMFYLGGQVVTVVANILLGQKLTDEPTCYKMFRADLLTKIAINSRGFEFCPEITSKISKLGFKISEVPISYYPRSIEEGKKIKAKDGLIAIWALFKYRFSD